jgi:hypothetical protein
MLLLKSSVYRTLHVMPLTYENLEAIRPDKQKHIDMVIGKWNISKTLPL